MNTLFAPVFMTFHKITDIHIAETGGSLKGFFSHPLRIRETLSKKINWDIQYGFVFAKTIPLFWYPAHTLTFLLPSTLQVLFAAFLGVALGVILSIKK
jgi:ABC-type phosphate/phosphonate transport system permease subunit